MFFFLTTDEWWKDDTIEEEEDPIGGWANILWNFSDLVLAMIESGLEVSGLISSVGSHIPILPHRKGCKVTL